MLSTHAMIAVAIVPAVVCIAVAWSLVGVGMFARNALAIADASVLSLIAIISSVFD